MNGLLAVKAGLSSRFPEEVVFRDMTPEYCLQLLDWELQLKNITVPALQEADSPP